MDNEHVDASARSRLSRYQRRSALRFQMEKLLLDRIKLYTELEIDFLDDEEEELPREEALFYYEGLQKLKAEYASRRVPRAITQNAESD